MKKIIIVLLICVMCLTACSEDGEYLTEGEKVRNIGGELYEGYKEKDKDKIMSLLSENLKEKLSTERKIEESLECIDGNIVGYEEIRGSAGAGEVRGGEEILSVGSGVVLYVRTDTNKMYCLDYVVTLINKEDEGNVGVTLVYFIDVSTGERIFEIGE